MRCGIDIVEVARMQRLIDATDTWQFSQIFTEKEWQQCHVKVKPAESLAGRFAVKEACMKLFPAETNSKELSFNDIEVVSDNYGAPMIHVSEKLAQVMQRYKMTFIRVSLSHTKELATGMAVAEYE